MTKVDHFNPIYPTPEARSHFAAIIVGSTVEGIIIGVANGFFARKGEGSDYC
jgi:hypothetical protein